MGGSVLNSGLQIGAVFFSHMSAEGKKKSILKKS